MSKRSALFRNLVERAGVVGFLLAAIVANNLWISLYILFLAWFASMTLSESLYE